MGALTAIKLPTYHSGQNRAYKLVMEERFVAIRCGRRWGKTKFDTALACSSASKHHEEIGFFAPDYKRLVETYQEAATILAPVMAPYSHADSVIRTTTGGRIDFWTLEDDSAGRSRRYHKVFIDEAAFTKPNMTDIWERSIKPTLFDYSGQAIVTSNTNGVSEDNFFWRICNLPEYGFKEYHAPTHDNPLLPLRQPGELLEVWREKRRAALKKLIDDNAPLVYQQEHLADFVDFRGTAFFQQDKLLVNGQPVDEPLMVDVVFATIDTAVKDTKEHDCTAVIYWGLSKFTGHKLVILDWDIIQIEGALLETWLPTVYQNLQAITQRINVRRGTIGAFIEDKQSGSILLQQAKRRGWMAHPIESKLTDLGKDGRAISVSGYVYRGDVKIARAAYDKVTALKGITRNHMLVQVGSFKIGDKEGNKRADDLTDCFTYGIAIGLGDSKGF